MYNEVMTSTSQRYSPEVWSFAASEEHFANFQFHGWLNFEGSNLEMLHSFVEVQWARAKCSKTVRLEVWTLSSNFISLPTSRNSTTHYGDFRPRGL